MEKCALYGWLSYILQRPENSSTGDFLGACWKSLAACLRLILGVTIAATLPPATLTWQPHLYWISYQNILYLKIHFEITVAQL